MIRILAICLGLIATSAKAAEPHVRLEMSPPMGKIAGLSFASPDQIEIVGSSKAKITGRYTIRDGSLVIDSKELELSKNGEFRCDVPLAGAITRIDGTAIDKRGNAEKFILTLTLAAPSNADSPKASQWQLSPQVSLVRYEDSRVSPFSETLLTLKAGYSRKIGESRWEIGAGGYYSLLAISAPEGQAVRFLGLNARIGYTLLNLNEKWKLVLMGGGYYTRTFVSDDRFGYQNVSGPQLFPTLTWIRDSKSRASAYIKFSPVSGGPTSLLGSSREVAAGLSYGWPAWGIPVTASLDVAQLLLAIGTVRIRSDSVSVGLGLAL